MTSFAGPPMFARNSRNQHRTTYHDSRTGKRLLTVTRLPGRTDLAGPIPLDLAAFPDRVELERLSYHVWQAHFPGRIRDDVYEMLRVLVA